MSASSYRTRDLYRACAGRQPIPSHPLGTRKGPLVGNWYEERHDMGQPILPKGFSEGNTEFPRSLHTELSRSSPSCCSIYASTIGAATQTLVTAKNNKNDSRPKFGDTEVHVYQRGVTHETYQPPSNQACRRREWKGGRAPQAETQIKMLQTRLREALHECYTATARLHKSNCAHRDHYLYRDLRRSFQTVADTLAMGSPLLTLQEWQQAFDLFLKSGRNASGGPVPSRSKEKGSYCPTESGETVSSLCLLSQPEWTYLFQHHDREACGRANWHTLLLHLRGGAMKHPARVVLVRRAFQKLQQAAAHRRQGAETLVVSRAHTASHGDDDIYMRDVMLESDPGQDACCPQATHRISFLHSWITSPKSIGKYDADHGLLEHLQKCWEVVRTSPEDLVSVIGPTNVILSWDEFLSYYEDVSAMIPQDHEFSKKIETTWRL